MTTGSAEHRTHLAKLATERRRARFAALSEFSDDQIYQVTRLPIHDYARAFNAGARSRRSTASLETRLNRYQSRGRKSVQHEGAFLDGCQWGDDLPEVHLRRRILFAQDVRARAAHRASVGVVRRLHHLSRRSLTVTTTPIARPAFWAGLDTDRRYSFAEVAEANNFDLDAIAENEPELLLPLTPVSDYYALRTIPLDAITMPGGTSVLFDRADDAVDDLCNAYQAGEPVPPVLVEQRANGSFRWTDGQHRMNAALAIGLATIPAFVLIAGAA